MKTSKNINYRLWNNDEDDIIKKFYFSLNGQKEICKRLPHRNWHNINRRATKLGLRKFNYWTSEEESLLKRIYYNSTDDILMSNFPNRSMASIDIHAGIMKIRKGYANARKSKASVLLNETPETYYWIGFILADGHINKKGRLTFALSKKDKTSVENFANFVSSNIKEYKRCFRVTIQNQDILPMVCKKFSIVPRKTYYPPKLDFIHDNDLLLSLIIGYIDGDGSIRNLHQRKDFAISLHAHKSWIEIYKMFENKLYSIFEIKPRHDIERTKLDACNYVTLHIGDSRICKKIKQKAIELKLPIMKRKWDIIDLNYVSRMEKSDTNNVKINQLQKEGYSVKEIALRLNIKPSCIYQLNYRQQKLFKHK